MTPLEKVQSLYGVYLEQAAEVEKNRRFSDGILGFGKRTSDDPCHERFIQSLSAQMAELKENGVESAELRDVIAYIFQAQNDHQKPLSVYWMLVAAHSVALDMIPLLTREDAAALYDQYSKSFKRRDRLPVQTKTLKLLQNAMR